MTDKRCFLQWFVLCLGYAVITFFAAYYGVFQQVWTVDVTHLTSVIAMMFIAACGYLGAASWRYDNPWLKQDKRFAQAVADTNIGRAAAYLVTLLGLLGTVIGLTIQVRAMASIDLSNAQHALQFVVAVLSGLGTALYATGCGIVASFGITVSRFTAYPNGRLPPAASSPLERRLA